MESYLDESGIHDQARVCVIAGYFGTQIQLRKLEMAWKRTLRDFDFPMEKFHAKELIKTRDHRKMLEKLAKTIGKQRKVHPVSYGIVVEDFNSFTLEQRRFLTGATLQPNGELDPTGCPSKPYFVPFQNVVKLLTYYAPEGGKVHFSFGIDRPFYGYATELFKQMTDLTNAAEKPWSTWQSRERLGIPQAPLAKETAQLQAADLLAHLTYLHMKEWLENGKVVRPSEMLTDCITNTRNKTDHQFQDGSCLELVLNEARRYVPNAKV